MKIGPGFNLPAAIADDAIGIVGRRGRGKTTTATVLVEELHKVGERFVVLDPIGVWWGLRSSRDGKGAGIPVVVMGGDHGDVPLEVTAGKVVAQFLADNKGASAVLDLSLFRKGEMVRFSTDFLEELYHKNRAGLHVVIDEADRFAPQRVSGDTARLVGAAEDVCKMGRAHGLHPILITQRPAGLNKNVLNQIGLLVAHALTGPQDRKALDEWVRDNATEEQRAEFTTALPKLARGVAWFWQPEQDIFRQVEVRDRETFDSSATPKGDTKRGPKVLAPVDLDTLKTRIADSIERAKAEDPKALRAELARVQKQSNEHRNAADSWKQSFANLTAKREAKATAALKPADLKRLETAIDKLEAADAVFQGGLRKAIDTLSQRQQVVVAELATLRATLARANQTSEREKGAVVAHGRSAVAPAAAAPVVSRAPIAARRSDGPGSPEVGTGGLRRMLVALAQRPQGLTKGQIGIRAGVSSRSGTFDTYLSRARKAGWLVGEGGVTRITEEGVAALGAYEALPDGPELLRYWLNELGGSGAARLLSAIADAYPRALTKAELCEAANMAPSGTFDTYMSRLRTLELIQGKGEIRLSEELAG